MLTSFREKKSQVGSFGGEVILKGDDFKKYVNALRNKSNEYKEKRQALSELKSEYGVLARIDRETAYFPKRKWQKNHLNGQQWIFLWK